MDNVQKQHLAQALERGAACLRESGLPAEHATQLERLIGQIDQPCVLVVVGRMKAGKSTFVNALLGEDVARVGITETTATINRFRYGNPADADRPVRCRWRGGQEEHVSRDFLDSLQGTDPEALRRAEAIDHIEYLLPNPYLRDVTLVDTPGTAAIVPEHQDRTAEFLSLHRQLRERHDQDTQRIGSEADAVIYLVGPVARATDQNLLEEFGLATGGRSRALNAVGVLAKIDLQPELLARRQDLAAKIAGQLKDSLNTVVPVSAGLCRVLSRLCADGNRELRRWMTLLRQIPAQRLQKLLDDDQLFLGDYDDCPVTVAQREQMLGQLDWGVFTTIARVAADPALGEAAVVARLEDLAGFAPLREVLERHFFKRSRFLRGYRITCDARRIVSDLRFRVLPASRKRDREENARRDRFLRFLASAGGDAAVARELSEFVSLHCDAAKRADRLEAAIKKLDRELARLFHGLEEYNADFEALDDLQTWAALFSPAEVEELRALFGLRGTETEKRLPPGRATPDYVGERQRAWSEAGRRGRDPARCRVARRAEARYALVLHELTEGLPARTATT